MSQPTFAKSVGQATIDVAVGVAEKVARVTQTDGRLQRSC